MILYFLSPQIYLKFQLRYGSFRARESTPTSEENGDLFGCRRSQRPGNRNAQRTVGVQRTGALSDGARHQMGRRGEICLDKMNALMQNTFQVVENAPYETSVEFLDKYNCDFCVHGSLSNFIIRNI